MAFIDFQVVVIHCDEQDVVVLCPQWLCSDILGQLLSIEFMAQARVTGCYTAEDFQAAFTECDAGRLLALLEQLQICIQVIVSTHQLIILLTLKS